MLNDLLWQTEFRNSIHQYAAGHMQRLKDRDLIAFLGQIARTGQSGRPGTNDRDLMSI